MNNIVDIFKPVLASEKKGFWSMFSIMLGFTFFSASMWTGGTLGSSLTFNSFMLAIFIGNLILGIYTGLLAYIASKTSLTTHTLARFSFGHKGSYLASFLLATTQIGWFGVGVAMFAYPVHQITNIDLFLLVIIAGAVMTYTATHGISAIAMLGMVAVPAIAILGFYSITQATIEIGGLSKLIHLKDVNEMSIYVAISLAVATFISGGTLTPDFTRYSKTTKISVSTTVVAFFIGNSLMFIFGAIGAMVYGKSDISDVFILQGLIIPAIIVLGLNIWTTNNNALYSSGLGYANILGMDEKKLTLVNGIIGTLLAVWLFQNFVGFLGVLNALIPGIGAIIIADYFIVNRANYQNINNNNFKNYNYNAIISWIASFLIAQVKIGIPPLNSVIGAIIVYVLLSKIGGKVNVN